MKSTLKLIAVNLIVLIGLLLVLEVVFRLRGYTHYSTSTRPDISVSPGGKYFQKDSILGYKHLSGKYKITLQKKYEFTTTHDTNTLRITAPEKDSIDLKKSNIWILGCSFTHGWSINDEETFAWRLQSKLDNYNITNWGVNGYGTIHFLLQLKEALKSNAIPDVVIVNHADFHFERNIFSYDRRLNVSRWNMLGRLNQPYATLTNTGKLSTTHSKNEYDPWCLSSYSALTFYIQRRYESYQDKKIHSESKQITRLIFDEITQLCKQNQIKLLLTNIGFDKTFIQEYSSENNIYFVDISVNTNEEKYNNKPYDTHPSAKANEVYANKLYAYLIDNLIEPQKTKE